MTTFTVAVFLASLGSVAAAQAPTIEAIAARHVQALGGAERLRAVKTMRQTGTMSLTVGDRTMEGPFLLELKRPLKARFEADLGAGKLVRMVDGASGWQVRPGTTTAEPLTAEELTKQETQELDPWLLDYQSRGVSVEYLGRAQVGSHAALKLKLTYQGRTVHSYLDEGSYLEIKRDRLGPDGRAITETLVGPYVTVDGLKIQTSLEVTYAGGKLRSGSRVDKTELNVEIPDARFAPPK